MVAVVVAPVAAETVDVDEAEDDAVSAAAAAAAGSQAALVTFARGHCFAGG